MSMSIKVELDTKGLDDLEEMLSKKAPYAKVGVLGDSTNRTGQMTNAKVGAIHELNPNFSKRRSFLRVPLNELLMQHMEKSGAFTEEALQKIVDDKSLYSFIEKMGIVGEGVVQGAFETGGYGKWKESNMKYKKNKQTLVETTQLRDSISSEVVENK